MEASEISTTIKILNDPGIFQKFLAKVLITVSRYRDDSYSFTCIWPTLGFVLNGPLIVFWNISRCNFCSIFISMHHCSFCLVPCLQQIWSKERVSTTDGSTDTPTKHVSTIHSTSISPAYRKWWKTYHKRPQINSS